MGGAGRLVALDIDGDLGRAALAALEAKHGALPRTLTQRTGSGGAHKVFHATEGQDLSLIRNSVKKLGANLDIRATGGQIVAAPTMHASGGAVTSGRTLRRPRPCPSGVLPRVRPESAEGALSWHSCSCSLSQAPCEAG